MATIELVVTDLDGTFWHTSDHVPAAVLATVAELERRAIPLLVATGRRVASTREPLAAVGLTPPAIMLNGAIGIDLATDTQFHLAPFPAHEALVAYDAFASVGVSPVVYIDHPQYDVWLGPAPDTNPAHARSLGARAGVVADLRGALTQCPVLGFSMIGVPYPDAETAFAAVAGVAEVHLDRSIDHPGLASFTAAPRNQSKWDGVLAYCDLHDIDTTKVLAVADGPNDIELLTNAAVRAVPKVAHPSALELATTVIPSARDGGWADILALLD